MHVLGGSSRYKGLPRRRDRDLEGAGDLQMLERCGAGGGKSAETRVKQDRCAERLNVMGL